MIIQCPSCETRFSVDAELISGVKNPRYHCSRCDHLFEPPTETSSVAEEPPLSSFVANSFEQLDLLPATDSVAIDTVARAAETLLPPLAAPTVPVFEDSLEISSSPRATMSTYLDDEPLPLVTANWPDGSPNKIHEADLRSAVAPEIRQRARKKWSGEQPAADRPIAAPASPNGIHMPPSQPAPSPVVRTEPSFATIDDFIMGETTHVAPDRSERLLRTIKPGFFSPVLFVCACPIVCAALLFCWSRFLSADASHLQKLLSTLHYHPVQLAPVGLDLVDVESDVVTLFDGRQVLEIGGKLRNQTSQALKDIQIEARLFDSHNRPIGKKLVHFDNTLAHALSIDNLREDALHKMENQPTIRGGNFMPDALQNVRIVFTRDIETARWFTARVYTVKVGADNQKRKA